VAENLAFAEDPVKNTLPVGTKLDRYGGPNGSFLSPKGTPFEQRALAPRSKAGGTTNMKCLNRCL
jgi:filamentous hemagglutinin